MGMKVPSKRFWYLKGKIVLDWFNLTFESYKVDIKTFYYKVTDVNLAIPNSTLDLTPRWRRPHFEMEVKAD